MPIREAIAGSATTTRVAVDFGTAKIASKVSAAHESLGQRPIAGCAVVSKPDAKTVLREDYA